MSKKWWITLIVLAVVLMTGSVNSAQIGDRKIVLSMAISKEVDGYAAVLEVLSPDDDNDFLEVEAPTMEALVHQFNYKEVFLESLDQIFICEDLLLDGGAEYLRESFINLIPLRPGAKLFAFSGDLPQEWHAMSQQETEDVGFFEIADISGETMTIPRIGRDDLGVFTDGAIRISETAWTMSQSEYTGYLLLNRPIANYRTVGGIIVKSRPQINHSAKGALDVRASAEVMKTTDSDTLQRAVDNYIGQCKEKGENPIDYIDDFEITHSLIVNKP